MGRGRTPGWTASFTTWRALLEQEFEMQEEVARTARDTIRQMNTQIEQEILFWHRA